MKSHLKNLPIIFLVIVLALSFSCKKAEGPFKEAEDPFLWLEEVEGQKALDWVRTENDRSLKGLTEDPRFEALYQEGLEHLTRTDRLPGVTIIGEHSYDLLQDAEHVREFWRRTSLQSFLSGKPEVFFYTSTKDDRVHPGHARKMAAKMRTQGHPYLYYENIEGGHSAAANLNESVKLNALQSVYLLQLVKPQAQPRIRVTHGVPTGPVSPALYRIREQYDVLAPMRDGVRLAMDLVRPDADGAFPVVLIRTPYDKVTQRGKAQVRDLVRRGYLVAIQDCRGRFNSDGAFGPYRQEHADGFDTVEWIAQQPWCDGNIGMIGGSYVGQTQWYAASGAPRALKAIVPTVSPPGHPFTNEPFYGGAMLLAMLEWTVAMGRRSFQVPGLEGIMTEHKDYFEALPLAAMDDAAGTSSPFWDEWMRHPTYDAFWESCGYEQYWSKITVPALNLTGWWDMNFIGSPSNFVGMRSHGATREAREGQRLVIGPWPHWVNRQRVLSGLDFGPDALVDLNGYALRFFDRWLRGKEENGLDDDARVHVFVLGANQWWETDSWPLPGTRPTPLYLRSGGRANSHRGDGTVSFEAPGNEPHDEYLSDPLDPVRFLWSLHEGSVDDRTASARSDVLCYTSEVLSEAVDVVGPVTAVLYASSSATDCDWHVRLVDVHPDGAARFLCHGVLRARFREGYHRTAFLTPNEVTRFEIDMTATGVRFLPGHRIRVEVASSWFPRFDRNPQTGTENWMTDETPPVKARQVVRHDRRYPSHVVLPLIPDAPRE